MHTHPVAHEPPGTEMPFFAAFFSNFSNFASNLSIFETRSAASSTEKGLAACTKTGLCFKRALQQATGTRGTTPD